MYVPVLIETAACGNPPIHLAKPYTIPIQLGLICSVPYAVCGVGVVQHFHRSGIDAALLQMSSYLICRA
ncbi:hypothetical protein AOQ84DRAFT_354320 [Glonium stellatum]|uniref:Uncharacterized protein n=1 Tax=Glonium stellatum TaxID=574774 RepID=A0A8E2JTC6_9PEZI|nr:hypothetical protein AOQ84DRAFT_354320 [Glonium stellatum]